MLAHSGTTITVNSLTVAGAALEFDRRFTTQRSAPTSRLTPTFANVGHRKAA